MKKQIALAAILALLGLSTWGYISYAKYHKEQVVGPKTIENIVQSSPQPQSTPRVADPSGNAKDNILFPHIENRPSQNTAAPIKTETAIKSPYYESFQGAKVGDLVIAKSGMTIVNKATITAITADNISVTKGFETHTFSKTNVAVQLVALPLVTEKMPKLESNVPASPQIDGQDIGSQLLKRFSGDRGYPKAMEIYKTKMAGVMSGETSLDDLVKQAEGILMTVDKYLPERAKDPQYEPYIAQLRDFVRRAKAGEKIEYPKLQ